LLCGPRVWLLADVASDRELLDELWSLVDASASLSEVLAALTRAGRERALGFAAVDLEPAAEKVVLRGVATVHLETAGGEPVELECRAGVSTWVEHPAAGAVSAARLAGGDAAAAGDASWFPLRAGVVLASVAELGAPSPPSAPHPAEAPASDEPAAEV